MNEQDWRRYCLEHAGEVLPPDAEALIQHDPALRREVERLVAVKRLVSLKRHEQPDQAALERCIRSFDERAALRGWPALQTRIRDWAAFNAPVPAMAWAAAVLIMLAAASMVYVGNREAAPLAVSSDLPTNPPDSATPGVFATTSPDSSETNEAANIASADTPTREKPLIILRLPSGELPRENGRASFGNEETVPVSFDY